MPLVKSSAILRLHYDEKKRALDVTFVTKRIYRYFDVPPEVYAQFETAESKGGFFNAHILDKYRCEDRTPGWG